MTSPIYQLIAEKLEDLNSSGAMRTTAPPPCGSILNLSTNDCLGIASDEELRREFLQRALGDPTMKLGSRASRLLTGTSIWHEALEKHLSRILGKPGVLLAPSGWHANSGLAPALAGLAPSETLFIADQEIHASFIDGFKAAAASGAGFTRFRHNDAEHLAALLRRFADEFKFIFVAVESLYSMDGDWSPLKRIVELKKQHPNMILIVDEAHSFGAYGPNGLGFCAQLGVLDDVDVLIGTCGKALGGHGAFIASNELMRSCFVNFSRPLIFTTAPSALDAAWILNIVEKLPAFEDRRRRLAQLVEKTNKALGRSIEEPSHIIPIIAGSAARALSWSERLLEQGVLVGAVRPPTVRPGTSRLRLSLSSSMTDADFDKLLDAMKSAGITGGGGQP